MDLGDLDDLRLRFLSVDRVFPLESPAASRPAIVIRPHRRVTSVQGHEPEVANWEEL